MLEDLLSMCYQVSLLREEERPLRFRLILCEPARFAPDGTREDPIFLLLQVRGARFVELPLH